MKHSPGAVFRTLEQFPVLLHVKNRSNAILIGHPLGDNKELRAVLVDRCEGIHLSLARSLVIPFTVVLLPTFQCRVDCSV